MSAPWPVTFFAPGKPVPQGSKNLSRHGAMYEQGGQALKDWRRTVWAYARQAMRRHPPAPATVPMVCEVTFVMHRPKSTPKTRPTPPAVKKPDADKLARAIGDAITGVICADDSQIVRWVIDKRIAELGERTGAHITAYPKP